MSTIIHTQQLKEESNTWLELNIYIYLYYLQSQNLRRFYYSKYAVFFNYVRFPIVYDTIIEYREYQFKVEGISSIT